MEADLSSPQPNPYAFFLWSPNIELDENLFTENEKRRLLILDGRHSLADGIKRTGRAALISYARWYQSHYKAPKIVTFRLRLSNPAEFEADVAKCIGMAAERFVEDLELDFSDPDRHDTYPEGSMGYYTLPPEVYRLRESLHTLRISGCHFEPARLHALDSLRKLCVERIPLSPESLHVLIEHCRNLEDLTLRNLSMLSDGNIIDNNDVLLSLTIEECVPMVSGLRIVAPKLRYFRYSGYVQPIILESLKSIEAAELEFSQEYRFQRHGDLFCDVLCSLQNARFLTLCSYVTRVIATGEENPHVLPICMEKLQHLTLEKTTLQPDELTGIVFLVRSYPKLERLTIKMGPRTNFLSILLSDEDLIKPAFGAKDFWEAHLSFPFECLDHHLKKVEVDEFEGTENEMLFLQFLLEKTKALQELHITLANGTPLVNSELSQKLHQYQKVSADAKIFIS